VLLPFNQVDSRSTQLLLAHPLDKKTRKGDEVIVVSEALQLGNGLDQYIVVTTMRVALFRLKVVDGQGFITANLVWQLRFEKGSRIASSLGHRGHNGSILYVSRYTSQKREELNESDDFNPSLRNTISEIDGNDQDGPRDHLFDEPKRRYYNPELSKKFSPSNTAASRLRTAWPFAANEGDGVIRHAIEGEFKQSSQLSRIHNAICCLSGDFESLLYDGNQEDGSEGKTSFGPLIFERTQQKPQVSIENGRDDFNSLYSSLERSTWECNRPQHDAPLFSEGLINSGVSPFSSWLEESRARGMCVPPPPPILPSNADPISDTFVHRVVSDLETGLGSSDSASQDIHSYAHSLNFKQELSKDDNGGIVTEDDHSISSPSPNTIGSNELKNPLDNIAAEDSFENEGLSVEGYIAPPLIGDSKHMEIFPTGIDPSAKRLPLEEISISATLPQIDESLIGKHAQTCTQSASPTLPSAVSAPQETGYDRFGLDERLRRVEALLENLGQHDSSAGTIYHVGRLNTPSQLIQHGNDQYSAAPSSFNPSGHHSNEDRSEVEALRKEIKDLKMQLAATTHSIASKDVTHEFPTEVRVMDETTELERKKHRVRIKNKIFSRKRAK